MTLSRAYIAFSSFLTSVLWLLRSKASLSVSTMALPMTKVVLIALLSIQSFPFLPTATSNGVFCANSSKIQTAPFPPGIMSLLAITRLMSKIIPPFNSPRPSALLVFGFTHSNSGSKCLLAREIRAYTIDPAPNCGLVFLVAEAKARCGREANAVYDVIAQK